jgi:hypothetical protein
MQKETNAEDRNVKPGYRTTEFWLSAAASAVGLMIASGALAEGSAAETIVGVVASALVALGYSAARGQAKGGNGK